MDLPDGHVLTGLTPGDVNEGALRWIFTPELNPTDNELSVCLQPGCHVAGLDQNSQKIETGQPLYTVEASLREGMVHIGYVRRSALLHENGAFLIGGEVTVAPFVTIESEVLYQGSLEVMPEKFKEIQEIAWQLTPEESE